jgi:hypothetical protein
MVAGEDEPVHVRIERNSACHLQRAGLAAVDVGWIILGIAYVKVLVGRFAIAEIFDVATQKSSINTTKAEAERNNKELLLCTYCNAGCNAVIISWILNGMKESPEVIADVIWESAKKGVFSILFPDEEFK